MIFTVLLNIIYGFLHYFVTLLPIGNTSTSEWVAGIYTIWAYVNAFSFIVPVNMLVTCLGIAMIFHAFVLSWNIMHWLYGLLRGNRMH